VTGSSIALVESSTAASAATTGRTVVGDGWAAASAALVAGVIGLIGLVGVFVHDYQDISRCAQRQPSSATIFGNHLRQSIFDTPARGRADDEHG
jgi:hypothetical protein